MRGTEPCKAPTFMGKVNVVDVVEREHTKGRGEKPAERGQVTRGGGEFKNGIVNRGQCCWEFVENG